MKPSFLLLLFAVACTAPVHAVDPAVLKLHGRWNKPLPGDYRLGYAEYGSQTVACSEKWIVAGAPRASDAGTREGAVQVFNGATGAWVRKVVLKPAIINAQFGASVAISGDRLVVGAPGINSGTGAAYVFHLTTGIKLLDLTPNAADVAASDWFGCAVAVAGDKVLVGAENDDLAKGSCYVFDLKTGAQLAKLQAPDGGAGHYFGVSVAAEGGLALMGAPGADFKGAGYLFDLNTYGFIRKLQSTNMVLADQAGYSAALHQGKALLGAPGSDILSYGVVYVFDVFSGTEGMLYSGVVHESQHFGMSISASRGQVLIGSDDFGSKGSVDLVSLGASGGGIRTYEAPDPLYPPLQKFGQTAALCGNMAVVAAPTESTQAEAAGALYLLKPAQVSMPLLKKAAKGEFAPGGVATATVAGSPEINYAGLGDAFINPDGEMAFTGKLSGTGSGGGKDTGGWSTLPVNWSGLNLALKSRQINDGVTIGIVSNPLINHSDAALFRATLTGFGVTPLNNLAVYRDNGQTSVRVLRTGDVFPALDGGVLSGFATIVQNRAFNRLVAAATLRKGVASTDATSDSAVLWVDAGNLAADGAREGRPAGATGLTYGQFTGRVAGSFALVTYDAAVAGAPLTNQAVFQKAFGSPEVLVARKNDPATGAGGARYSGFLGESSDADDTVLYKAALSGATPATNEGLWTRTTGGTASRVLQKDDSLPGLSAVKVTKIINYWQAGGQTLVLAQLKGPGVKGSNDQAVLLFQTSGHGAGQKLVLMREGDPAPGCDPATIGTINRVDVDPRHGQYLALATLAGAPAGTELVLFRGCSAYPAVTAAEVALRRPVAILRKGMLYDNQPGKLKSFFLPAGNLTASGAGCTGLGQAVQEPASAKDSTNVVLTAEFENGARQILQGRF